MRDCSITLSAETTDAERTALLDTLQAANLSGPHLEIGTAAGGTLKELMGCYPASNRPPFVIVDPLTYFPGQRHAVEKNLVSAGIDLSRVEFRESTSGVALKRALAGGERYSFIFIDAVHDASHVMQDLTWTRMLDVGGLVALHDCSPKFPGVLWSLQHFLKRQPNYIKIASVGTLVVLQKAAQSAPEVSLRDRALAVCVNPILRWRSSLNKRLSSPVQPKPQYPSQAGSA